MKLNAEELQELGGKNPRYTPVSQEEELPSGLNRYYYVNKLTSSKP